MQIRPRVPPRDWTVLVYNAGTSNAGMSCTANLLDMERVGSDDSTQVVCMNARSEWVPEKLGLWKEYQGARTYALGPGTGEPGPQSELAKLATFLMTSPADIRSTAIAHDQHANMGDPATLRNFLLENIERYPSRHVAIIIAGHGAGFAGQAISHDPEGRISNEALGSVLKDVHQKIGKKVDLVDLNNCYGASLEVLYPLRDSVECAVGSQSVQFGPTQPLGDILQRLQAQPDLTGPELGHLFVDASRNQPLSNLSTRTLSAVDLQKLEPLADSLAELHQALMDQKIAPARIRAWMAGAEKDEYASVPRSIFNYDLLSFAQQVDAPEVKAQAEKVARTLRESIVAEQHADPQKDGLVSLLLSTLLQPDMPQNPAGLSIHYDTDVSARGNRLAQLKDTELGRKLKIEPFLNYVSSQQDAPGWLDDLRCDLRVFEHRHPLLRPAAMLAAAGAALALFGLV